MKTLTINYNHSSEPIRDCDAEVRAKEVIDVFLSQEEDRVFDTSNEIVIHVFRALVKEQYIEARYMEIQFAGETLELDVSGKLSYWPEGFCDYYEKIILRILGW